MNSRGRAQPRHAIFRKWCHHAIFSKTRKTQTILKLNSRDQPRDKKSETREKNWKSIKMILETLAISLSNLINFMWTCVAKPKRRTIWISHFTTRSLFKSCHILTLAYFCSMSYSWEVLDTNLISSVYLVVHLVCLRPVLYSMSANKSWFQKLSYLVLIAKKEIVQFECFLLPWLREGVHLDTLVFYRYRKYM